MQLPGKLLYIIFLVLIIAGSVLHAADEPPMKITATNQYEKEKDLLIFEGYVIFEYKDIILQADKAIFNRRTNELTAEGNVVLEEGNRRFSAEKFVFNTKTETGTFYNVFMYEDPQLTIRSNELEKKSKDLYQGKGIKGNECNQRIPHWSITASKAKIKMDKWARMRNFVLKIKDIPVLYLPYIHVPLNKERSTGFLLPRFSLNNVRGFSIGNGFFWAINRSNDATFYIDRWWNRGWGEGSEYRYQLTSGNGQMRVYSANDKLIGRQWELNGSQNQHFGKGFQLASQWDWFSNLDYIQSYENSLTTLSRRYKLIRAYLTKNWSSYSLNTIFENQETLFSSTNNLVTRKMPEITFQRYNQKLFSSPVYFSLDSSAGYFGKTLTQNNTLNYARADFFPEVSVPLTGLQWLTFTPAISARTTYYSDGLGAHNIPSNKGFLRDYYSFSMDFRGPNFSRIFNTPHLSFSPKMKHSIEPYVTYRYISPIDTDYRIISFDQVDSVYQTNMLTYGIANRIFIKKKIGTVDTPWELLSWDVSQNYAVAQNGIPNQKLLANQKFSPISSSVRFNPSASFSTDFRLSYDVNNKLLSNIALSNTIRINSFNLNLAWNYYNYGKIANTSSTNSQLRINSRFPILNNRFNISSGIDYNITQTKLMSASVGVIYNDDCYSIGFDYQRINLQIRQESQWSFSLSLPRIGNLLDFHSNMLNEQY